MAGRMVVGSAALADLVRPASAPDPVADQRVLPVAPELTGLLPNRGLRRGSTIAVAAGQPQRSGGTSLVLALLAEASRAGSWCAVVGVPTLGAGAAAELGIALDRLALVPNPGPEWATVVAALIDGVDVVVTAVPAAVSASVATRLAARARQRGSVLVPYGRWDGADVTLQVVRGLWEGLGQGRGRLRRREVTVSARGRGAAARPKEIKVWLPGDELTRVIPRAVPSTVGRRSTVPFDGRPHPVPSAGDRSGPVRSTGEQSHQVSPVGDRFGPASSAGERPRPASPAGDRSRAEAGRPGSLTLVGPA